MDRARDLVIRHQSVVDRVVDALMEKNRRTREELEAIMPQAPSG